MYVTPNLVSQAALFKTGSPNFVSTSLGTATEDSNGLVFSTFPESATAGSISDGDEFGVLLVKANGDFKVCTGAWDGTNKYVLLSDEEMSVGTLWADDDAVTISCVLTQLLLKHFVSVPQIFKSKTVTGTSYTFLPEDSGYSLCFTTEVGCVATLDDALPVGFQVQILQLGGGTVSIDVEGTDTLNATATGTGKETPAQWKSLFVAQYAAGAWLAI